MRIRESSLDRVRLSIRRSPREGLALLLGLCLLIQGANVAAGYHALRRLGPAPEATAEPQPLNCTDPLEGPACTGGEPPEQPPRCAEPAEHEACLALDPFFTEAPSLAEVYLARRHHHLSRMLPAAFPPTREPVPRLPGWLVYSADLERFLAEILRDATTEDHDWVARDPVVGSWWHDGDPLPSDAEVYAAAKTRRFVPAPTPPLQRRDLEALVAQGIVQERDGRYAVLGSPEAEHAARQAASDVIRYRLLLSGALQHFAEQHHQGARARWQREEEARRRHLWTINATAQRWATWNGLVFIGLAALSFFGWSWLSRRSLEVVLDPHALWLGSERLLWEQITDLIWREASVSWRVRGEAPATIGALRLTTSEARSLQQTCWALCERDRGERDHDAEAALAALVAQGAS